MLLSLSFVDLSSFTIPALDPQVWQVSFMKIWDTTILSLPKGGRVGIWAPAD